MSKKNGKNNSVSVDDMNTEANEEETMVEEKEAQQKKEDVTQESKIELDKTDQTETSDTQHEQSNQENENSILAKLEEAQDKYKRLLAEFENYKKRSRTETQNLLKFSQQPLALSILPNLDNMERALHHAEENDTENEFVKGVKMVYQGLLEALEEHDITCIEAKNQPFDPTKHEAIGIVETEETETDHIVNVFQSGFMLHDRVIRPSKVQVAKQKQS